MCDKGQEGDAMVPTKTKKILVIDDEEITTHLAKELLEKQGFSVVCAYDGEEGLRVAHLESPDLILLDILIPKIDGFEVCRRLKSEEQFKHVPILMFTGKNLSKDMEKGQEVGVDEYIVKPLSGKALIAVIRKHLKME